MYKRPFQTISKSIREYFTDTTVHGFRYVVQGKNVFEKGFWIIMIVSGFVISGCIIHASLKAWDETPLQTTIDKVSAPIQKLPYPAITIFDQKALQMTRKNRWKYIEQLLNMFDIDSINDVNNAEYVCYLSK